ncbi:trehalose transporter 1-like protein [Arctopsyche grandis]|uniref:trehalose transporter 1-like protein n=1 Tax=Arctopsyche grandis TaxID=121162 RepID=UPI00406D85BF
MTNEKKTVDSGSGDDSDSLEQKQDRAAAILENLKDGNLKKNLSLVFNITTSVDGLSTKETPLIESNTTSQRFSPLCRQSMAAMGSILATLSAGMTSGYSSTLLPQLNQTDSSIPMSQEISSWIASVAALPMFAGCIISGFMMESLGRRMTHLVLAIPFILGWVLISTTYNLPQLLIGRFLTGLCVGLLGPAGSIYIGEISDPKYRGFLLAGISLAISMGLLIVHVIGTYINWHLTAGISALVPFFSFVFMSFVPESPSWLASKGQTEKAVKAFKWLRGCDEQSMKELNALLEKQAIALAEANLQPKIPMFSKQKLINLKETFKRPEFIKPLLIMIAFFVTLQLSGVNAVAFYSVHIMQSTLGSGIDEYMAMLIIDSVRLLSSLAACILLRVVGRRPLALISGVFTVISLFGIATFRYVGSHQGLSLNDYSWVPLVFLIGYIVATSIGLTPLPWVMTGEVFPADLRGIGSGICTSMCFIAFFGVVKMAPAMFTELGAEGTFLSYGIVALLGTCTIYFFLPETKGRTLQDIEEDFRTGKKTEKREPESSQSRM